MTTKESILSEFTLEERRRFVERYTQRLAGWQSPGGENEYARYVAEAPEEWINKSFLLFAETRDYDVGAIRADLEG